jgi:hypothetical protein
VLANETPLSVTIRRALAARPALARELFGEARLPTLCQYEGTGKFVMEVLENENGNSTLEIVVELAADVNADATLAAELATTIRAHLERQNSEFSGYVPPERRTPGIRLLPSGEPRYFPEGIKHRYTR